MAAATSMLTARRVRLLDVGLVAWLVVWAVLGVLIWHDINAQTGLSEDVIKVGAAVRQTGDAFGVLAAVPLVGGQLGQFSDRLAGVGAEVEASGRESRAGIRRIAVVAGIGVGVLPAALVLLLYLPLRLAWRRDVAAIAATLRAAPPAAGLDRYLAHRALAALDWSALAAIDGDPWAALERGDVRRLADAELERLGLTRD